MQSRISLSPALGPAVSLASSLEIPVPIHPSLLSILPRLQLVHDCWDLLSNQKQYYLPRGEREPDSAYKRRIDAALPSGFFRDALRTFAGMLTASHWCELHVRGQKLIRAGTRAEKIPELLGITPIRWAEIVEACAVRVVAMNQIADEEEL